MIVELKPWEDAPIHEVDGQPCGPMVARYRYRGRSPRLLACIACGLDVQATPEQMAQAAKAENAWAQEVRRRDSEDRKQGRRPGAHWHRRVL